MTPSDIQTMLTTPTGLVIPGHMFRNELDMRASALMLEGKKDVILYRGNMFYTVNRPSLYTHVINLIDDALHMPSVQIALNEEQDLFNPKHHYDFCVDAVKMIILHDDGEEWGGEGLSFNQKVRLSHLEPRTKEFEYTNAPLCYDLAQSLAAQNKGENFIARVKKSQTSFQKELDLFVNDAHQDLEKYSSILEAAQNSLAIQQASARRRIPAGLRKDIEENFTAYSNLYNTCELPELRDGNAAALFAKQVDKICGLYSTHIAKRAKDPNGLCIPASRESNLLEYSTIRRGVEYLPKFTKAARANDVSVFIADVTHLTYQRLEEYTTHARPYLMLTRDKIVEPLSDAPLALHLEFWTQQNVMLTQRRKSHHPLEDTHMMSRDELVAKIRLMDRLQINDISVLEQNQEIFRDHHELYNVILSDLREEKPQTSPSPAM